MRNLTILIFVITISCSSQMKNKSHKSITNTDVNDLYIITKIVSVDSFYFIYCNKDEKNYKIISKKVNERDMFDKIKENEYYHFELTNFPDYSNNDNPLTGFSSTDPCFMLDKDTQVCKEQGIGLCTTKNLKGLYYIK